MSDVVLDTWSQIEHALEKTVKEAGEFGANEARNTKAFKNDGPLKAATNFHSIDKFSGFVLADKPYAQYLEEGNPSEGFIIHAKNGGVLHFQINGKDIFVKSVKAHGGYHFMAQAEDKAEAELPNIFNRNLNGI